MATPRIAWGKRTLFQDSREVDRIRYSPEPDTPRQQSELNQPRSQNSARQIFRDCFTPGGEHQSEHYRGIHPSIRARNDRFRKTACPSGTAAEGATVGGGAPSTGPGRPSGIGAKQNSPRQLAFSGPLSEECRRWTWSRTKV